MQKLLLSFMFLFLFSLCAGSPVQVNSSQSPTKAPVTAEDFLRRGLARIERDNRKGAIDDLTKAIELNPQLAAAYVNRGAQHLDGAAYDLAIADLTKAIELDSKNITSFINRAFAFGAKGDSDAALKDLATAINLDAKNIFPYLIRADILNQQGHYQGAIYDFNTAIEIDPQDAKIYGERALTQLALGEDALAEKDFKTCFALNPTLEVEYNKAANETKKNLSEVRKAVEQRKYVERVAKAHPEDFESQVKAGKANSDAQRFDEAIGFLIKANKLRATDPEVMLSLGRAHYESGKYSEAEKWLTAALKVKPDDVQARSGLALMFLLRTPPEPDRAIKELRRCLELEPDSANVLGFLVLALLEKGEIKEAELTLTKLENTAPSYEQLPTLKEKLASLKKTTGAVQHPHR